MVRWLILVAVLRLPAPCQPADPAADRGRQIYLKGESRSGTPVVAELSGGSVPASIVPCGSCHGQDGIGSSEGGITATSIRWADLTRPYEVVSPSGRKHSAYTEDRFRRALTDGVDPAGNRLDSVMPRFRISTADTNDLIAWLKQIGQASEEGLTSDSIVIGSLLPPNSAMSAALAAYFAGINRGGGLYGRRMDFRVATLAEGPGERLQAARRFVDQERPFALVGSVVSGFERELGDLLAQRHLPLIGAYTPRPVIEDPPNPEVFYLDGGLRAQAQALARFAVERFADGPKRVRVLASSKDIYAESAVAADAIFEQAGWTVTSDPSADPTLILTPLASLGDMLNTTGGRVLLPGLLSDGSIVASRAAREKRLFLAKTILPSDYEAGALREYQALAETSGLPKDSVASQFMALAAARLLVEGLQRSGRELSRAKLIDSLNHMFEFHTGFTPPLTFGPNRRVGFTDARIVNAGETP